MESFPACNMARNFIGDISALSVPPDRCLIAKAQSRVDDPKDRLDTLWRIKKSEEMVNAAICRLVHLFFISVS